MEKAQEYLDRNYKMIRGIDYNYIYRKTEEGKPKLHYMPIIPALINAEARIRLYDEMKKIEEKDLLYCDTDSITMIRWHKHKKSFKVGVGLGEFKVEKDREDCEIIARKTWRIGEDIKISGIHKYEDMGKDWSKGKVVNMRMETINTTKNSKMLGKFTTETRDLHKQGEDHETTQELLANTTIYIDEDINNITAFTEQIGGIYQ